MLDFILKISSSVIGILFSVLILRLAGYKLEVKKMKSKRIKTSKSSELNLFNERLNQTLASIKSFFPEIDGIKLNFKVSKGNDYLMAYMAIPFYWKHTVKVDWFLRKANDSALKGILAHELVHIIENIDSPIKSKIESIRNTSKSERQIDLEVVRRGLGSELYAFQKFHDKHFQKYKPEDGLTKKELKSLIIEKSD